MTEEINLESLINKHKEKIDSSRLPIEYMVANYERKCLAALMLEHNQGFEAFETGTWRGYTTNYLAEILPNKTIWTVDCPQSLRLRLNSTSPHQGSEVLPQHEIGEAFKGKSNVHQILVDSINFNILDNTKIGKLDFAFIDANHSYEYTSHDAKEALKLLVSGGVLILHNYNKNHIAVEETLGDFVEDGPCYFVQKNPQFDWKIVNNTCIVYTKI